MFTHNTRRLAISTVLQGTVPYLGIKTNVYFQALSNQGELCAGQGFQNISYLGILWVNSVKEKNCVQERRS